MLQEVCTWTITCTVDTFSKKFRNRGFISKISSGIHVSPIIGKVLNACPWKYTSRQNIFLYSSKLTIIADRSMKSIEIIETLTYSIVSSHKCTRNSGQTNK